MSAAEEVVRTWLQYCRKQFVMMNVPYVSRSKKGKRITREIDLLATDGTGRFADYEVKWRTTSWINATKEERIPLLIEQLKNGPRNSEIRRTLKTGMHDGSKTTIRKILVTPKKHFGTRGFASREAEFKKANIELLWFETIFEELRRYVEESKDKGQFDPIALGITRMITHYVAEDIRPC